jgi:hypothetical protein
MGTIARRQRQDGTDAYLAQMSLMKGGKIFLRESRSFDRRKIAETWMSKREAELEEAGALSPGGAVRSHEGSGPPLDQERSDR